MKASARSRISATLSAPAVDSVLSGAMSMSSLRSTASRPMLSSNSTVEARSGAAGSSAISNKNGRLAAVHGYTSPCWWTAL
ncbi:hypothetical protein [Streptomyces mirabilis]|uniref:hypothetical protein n=1 Tax=Streptomyces mirabilis TaxID=68239 RepID=UPI0036BFA508